jgi:hypothetical protein
LCYRPPCRQELRPTEVIAAAEAAEILERSLKRFGSLYRSGRSKVKNPAAPAVRREAEEEWR